MKDDKLNEELINKLVESYASMIRGICRKFYLVGGTSDDLYQEGMIGLLDAIRNFDESKGTIGDDTFKKYAAVCVKRQIIDAIRHNNTLSNKTLNTSIPIVMKNRDDDEFEIDEIATSDGPEEIYISKEKQEERLNILQETLSEFEKQVLGKYLEGKKTSTIAKELNKTPKSITNTIQRIKLKVQNN